jgi:hypothetical protein
MYDVYTQLALRDQLVKQALYNQMVQNALIKHAGVYNPSTSDVYLGIKPEPEGLFNKAWGKLTEGGRAAGKRLSDASKYLLELIKAHPWRAGGIGAGALLGLGGAGYGLSRLLSSSPTPPVPAPSVLDTLYGLAPGAGIGALAGAGLGGLGTLAAGGREARKEAIRNALIGALLGAAGGAGASYAGLI